MFLLVRGKPKRAVSVPKKHGRIGHNPTTSILACMKVLEVRPSNPRLARYIRLIWSLELDRAEAFGPPQRIVPDGIVEVVFHYGAPFSMRYAGETFLRQPASFAVSQTRRYLEIVPQGPSGFVAVRFEPWGAHHFFSLPVGEFGDRQIASQELWGKSAGRLQERLAEGCGTRHRLALVEAFLLRRLRADGMEDLESWVRHLRRTGGRTSITSLCRDLGVGQRRLERSFQRALGTTPKHYCLLTRFLRSCHRLQQDPAIALAQVAQDCGYADQAHFNRDFQAFSGLTPCAFRSRGDVAFLQEE